MSSLHTPELVVFDLDDCLWHPEMYTLQEIPSRKILGSLPNNVGEGTFQVDVHVNLYQ